MSHIPLNLFLRFNFKVNANIHLETRGGILIEEYNGNPTLLIVIGLFLAVPARVEAPPIIMQGHNYKSFPFDYTILFLHLNPDIVYGYTDLLSIRSF